MKIFGRKSAAQCAARPALSRAWGGVGVGGGGGGGGATPGEWPGGYDAQVRAAVLSNPVAQRALRLVSEGVGGAALKARGGSAQDGARMLALVKTRAGGQGLMETLAMHILLHGNGYVQVGTDPDGAPAALFALRPERVSVEADARGWPMAYRYRVGDRAARLASEDAAGRTAVIHVKAPHPLDDHYGLGCAGVAAGPVAIHNAASVWNKALLDNAARPSGVLVFDAVEDGAFMAAEQFERVRAELERAFQGTQNAGRPMLLEGGLKWQQVVRRQKIWRRSRRRLAECGPRLGVDVRRRAYGVASADVRWSVA